MKYTIILLSLLFSITVLTSCGGDDEDHMEDPQYSITFNSPDTEAKHLNDSIHIHIDFESAIEETVHHVNVRIYNKMDNTEIYNEPDMAHIHETSGKYEFHADFGLSAANGVSEHSDWIMEAKVWGHEEGTGEVLKSIEFHVHPE